MSEKTPPQRLIDDPAVGSLLRSFSTDPPPSAQARVWRKLEQPAPQKSSMRWAVPLAAVAGMMIAYLVTRPSTVAHNAVEIAAIEGTVSSSAPGEVLLPARAGQALSSGSRLRTAENGRAVLSLAGGARIDVAPSSLLAIESGSISLVEGRLLAALPARSRVQIFAGPWRVSGGHRFDLQRVGEADLEISVEEGEVILESEGRVERVHAGARFVSAPVVVAEPVVREAPAVVEAPERETPPTRSKKASKKARTRSRSPAPVVEAPAPPPVVDEPTPAPVVRETTPTPPVVAPSFTPEIPVAPREPTEAELYKQASETRDPQVALRLFDRIENKRGSFSELAGHQAARLEMRLGRYRDAAVRLDRLITLRPKGSFAQEARLSLIECSIRTGDRARASKELEKFLSLHPESERQPELRFLRAELSRSAGQCSKAIGDYRAAIGSRHDDDALYFLAWCLLETGAKSEGLEALENYLEQRPSGKHAKEAQAGIVRSR